MNASHLFPMLHEYVRDRLTEFALIPPARQESLRALSKYLRQAGSETKQARLMFLCTHNSRRSQLGQVWAAIAAEYFGVLAVESYSGGTEATAFYPSAVKALSLAGIEVRESSAPPNPRYRLQWTPDGEGLTCWSKRFSEPPNPTEGFCAVMMCSHADQSCPVIPGAAARISLPYDDPKEFDGTPEEQDRYAERSRQIARELLFAFAESIN